MTYFMAVDVASPNMRIRWTGSQCVGLRRRYGPDAAADSDPLEDSLRDLGTDLRPGLVGCRNPADQQVGVGGSGPTTVPLAKPCCRQLGGELVEIDDVIKASPAADTQMPAGSVG